MLHPLILLALLSLPSLIAGLKNLTIDDDHPSIRYGPAGAWHRSANTTLDFGYAHMLTENPNATATVNFTGVAVYFMSPRWPYHVSSLVTLDDRPPVYLDLVDYSRPNTGGVGPETVQSEVVWSAVGLDNTQHTLLVSVPRGHRFGIVDGLLYTVEDRDLATNPTATASLPTISSEVSDGPSEDPTDLDPLGGLASTAPTGEVVGGIIAAVIVILAVIALIIYVFFLRRRFQQRTRAASTAPRQDSFGTSLVEKHELGEAAVSSVTSRASRASRISVASISSPRSLEYGLHESVKAIGIRGPPSDVDDRPSRAGYAPTAYRNESEVVNPENHQFSAPHRGTDVESSDALAPLAVPPPSRRESANSRTQHLSVGSGGHYAY